jgi:hypothetical protein
MYGKMSKFNKKLFRKDNVIDYILGFESYTTAPFKNSFA